MKNKQVIITKQCEYLPPGSEDKFVEEEKVVGDKKRMVKRYVNRVLVRPGQNVTVTPADAERMIKGNVAKAIPEKKPEKPSEKLPGKPPEKKKK